MTVFIVLDLQVGGWTQSRGRKLQLNPVFAHSLEISLTNAQCSLNLSPCLALLLCPETHSGLLELKFCCSVNSSGSEVTDEFGGWHWDVFQTVIVFFLLLRVPAVLRRSSLSRGGRGCAERHRQCRPAGRSSLCPREWG